VRVTVRLLNASDRPPEFDASGTRQMDLPAGATLADVMAQITLAGVYISLVNDQVVQQADRATHTLLEADKITLLPALQGGCFIKSPKGDS
jgi:sulfur carrier protein ThiS